VRLSRVVWVRIPQLAEDAGTLKQLLRGFSLGSAVYGSSFDRQVTNEDIANYLPLAAAAGVDGLTVHHYPYNKPCNVSTCVCAGVAGAGGPAAASASLHARVGVLRRCWCMHV
jgi:hypothetical protein